MRIPLSLLVLGLVLAEIATFILVGEAIGVLPTLALVLFGMVTGAVLLRRAGVSTLMRMRNEAAAGRMPARPLLDGAVGAVAALLIMLPGFLTDLIGLLLLIPATRNRLWRGLSGRLPARPAGSPSFAARRAEVIDLEPGDYVSDRRADSPWRPDGDGPA